MTIDQCTCSTLQHVSCPAANASTSELHKIRLTYSNHESTLFRKAAARQAEINVNSCARGRVELRRRFYGAAVCAPSFRSKNCAVGLCARTQSLQRSSS